MPEKQFPFMLPLIGGVIASVPGAKVNIARIVEVIIIAVVCAGATAFLTLRTLETKMAQVEQIRIDDRIVAQRDRAEIKADIKEVKDLVMDHIISGYGKK